MSEHVEKITQSDMDDADRRRFVVRQLELAWAMVPHLRIGQLVGAASWLATRDRDPHYVDDAELSAAALQYAVESCGSRFEGVVDRE